MKKICASKSRNEGTSYRLMECFISQSFGIVNIFVLTSFLSKTKIEKKLARLWPENGKSYENKCNNFVLEIVGSDQILWNGKHSLELSRQVLKKK